MRKIALSFTTQATGVVWFRKNRYEGKAPEEGVDFFFLQNITRSGKTVICSGTFNKNVKTANRRFLTT